MCGLFFGGKGGVLNKFVDVCGMRFRVLLSRERKSRRSGDGRWKIKIILNEFETDENRNWVPRFIGLERFMSYRS